MQICDQDTFTTQIGCRKHVKNKHGWFYYFDSEPNDCKTTATPENREDSGKTSMSLYHIATIVSHFSVIGKLLESCLAEVVVGAKVADKLNRLFIGASKLISKFCCEDEELNWNMVEFSLRSPDFLFQFVDAMQRDLGLGHADCLAYLDAIADLADFCNTHSTPDSVLCNLNPTDIYLKRVCKTVSKMTLGFNGPTT